MVSLYKDCTACTHVSLISASVYFPGFWTLALLSHSFSFAFLVLDCHNLSFVLMQLIHTEIAYLSGVYNMHMIYMYV